MMIETLWKDLIEKNDRTSPAEYPDMVLITKEEFSEALRNAREEGLDAAASYVERIGSYGAERTAAEIRSL